MIRFGDFLSLPMAEWFDLSLLESHLKLLLGLCNQVLVKVVSNTADMRAELRRISSEACILLR